MLKKALEKGDQFVENFSKFLIKDINNKDYFVEISITNEKDKENTNGIIYYYFDKKDNFTSFDLENIGENIYDKYSSLNVKMFISSNIKNLDMGYVANGFMLTSWNFDLYKTKKENNNNENKIYFKVTDKDIETFNNNKIQAQSIIFQRYLSLIPTNDLDTTLYSNFVIDLFKGTNVSVEILEEDALQKENMNLLLSVGQASKSSKLIILKIGKNPVNAFIGKGIVYDTGGLGLKPAESMLTMYYDMTGSAVVLTTFLTLSRQKVNIELYGLMPLAENSIGSKAFRNGDIITSRSGKTVEIGHTDAEGRLILADAAHYAGSKLKCSNVICIGTLTGAAEIALGKEYGALCSNEESLIKPLISSWKNTGCKLHALPFDKEYEEYLSSARADISNISKGKAGTISGWMFIKMLCPDSVKYAGIDIAACSGRKLLSNKNLISNGMSSRSMTDFFINFK